MSWNATVDRLRTRAQHDAITDDTYTRTLLYEAVDEIKRYATALEVSEEQRAERERVLFGEAERLTALLKESDDELVQFKTEHPRLRSKVFRLERDLATARAHLRTLQGALNTLDVHATARHPLLVDVPADEWAAAFDGIDEARDYDPTLAALPTTPKEEPDA